MYALLLRSDASLEAKIISGWKVTEDLIKIVAVTQGENIPMNVYAWYKDRPAMRLSTQTYLSN